jgi:hypothetical protein
MRLVEYQPERAEGGDRLIRRPHHVNKADIRTLQLAFIPLARRWVVERGLFNFEDPVEVGKAR